MGEIAEAGIAAVQRIVGVPAISDRAHPRLERIIEEQPADEAIANLKQLLHHFDRGKRADDARDRPENAGLGAWRDRAFRGRLGEEAAIGGARLAPLVGLESAEGRDVTVERTEGGEDERLLGEITGIVDEIARGEIVGAVSDDVVTADDGKGIRGHEAGRVETGRHMRIEAFDRRGGAPGLGPAHALGIVDDLAVEIVETDAVAVDDPDFADTGSGEIKHERRAEPAGADDENAGGFQLLLALAADLLQHQLPLVALDLLLCQHNLCQSLSSEMELARRNRTSVSRICAARAATAPHQLRRLDQFSDKRWRLRSVTLPVNRSSRTRPARAPWRQAPRRQQSRRGTPRQ